jgi:CHASE3 domain sensor protein
VGLRDRDYMRKKPSDDDWDRYNEEMTDAEYDTAASKRNEKVRRYKKIRWLVIGFVLVILLIVIIAIFAPAS